VQTTGPTSTPVSVRSAEGNPVTVGAHLVALDEMFAGSPEWQRGPQHAGNPAAAGPQPKNAEAGAAAGPGSQGGGAGTSGAGTASPHQPGSGTAGASAPSSSNPAAPTIIPRTTATQE